jgi:hypothetical protein
VNISEDTSYLSHNTPTQPSKIARYKINVSKSVAFLDTNNEPVEKGIRKTISFTITSETRKYQK